MNDHDNQCVLHGDRLTKVETLLTEIKDEYLSEIRQQVRDTNGRVGKLEQSRSSFEAFRQYVWLVICALATAIGTLWAAHINVK